jgi:hypothetical protein
MSRGKERGKSTLARGEEVSSAKWAYTDVRSIDWSSYLDWSRDPKCPWCGLVCGKIYGGKPQYEVSWAR